LPERLAEHRLRLGEPVVGSNIDVVDAGVKGGMNGADRFAFIGLAENGTEGRGAEAQNGQDTSSPVFPSLRYFIRTSRLVSLTYCSFAVHRCRFSGSAGDTPHGRSARTISPVPGRPNFPATPSPSRQLVRINPHGTRPFPH